MSKVERKEFLESRTTRMMTPTRLKRSNPNLTEFDNNLDNLLEDLQSTVARPGSALAPHNGHVRECSRSYNVNSRSNSLNRRNEPLEYNTDDVYSYTSPDGRKNVKTTRKETYSYKTGGIQRGGDLPPERVRMQNNINQLDSLLDDLQQVKQTGAIYNVGNQFGQDPGYQNFNQNKVMSEKRIVERDISGYPQSIEIIERPVRDDPDASIREFEEYKHRDYNKEMTTTSTRTVPALKTSSLNRNTKMSNIQQYPIEIVETNSHDINPEILANLDPELLPSGNTKVTTTIKTYTYEIPGSGNPTDIIASPNATILSSAHSTPSKSFVYNSAQHNTDYSSSQAHNVMPPHRKTQQPPSPTMGSKFQQQDNRLVQQETITTRNYQPSNIVYEDSSNPNKRTYIYNETTLTRNPVTMPMPAEKPYSPPQTPSHQPRNEIRHHISTHESTHRSRSSDNQQHTSNVTNIHHHGQPRSASSGRQSPYLNGIAPDYNVSEIIETFEAQAHGDGVGGGGSAPSTPGGSGKDYPPGFIYPSTSPQTASPATPPSTPKSQRKAALPVTAGAHQPPSSSTKSTVQYKSYSSTSNTSSNNQPYGGGNYLNKSTKTGYYYNPDVIDPKAYPRRFPVDENDNAPPKDVQLLLKNIGAEPPTSPLNAGYIAHEQEMVQQRKVEQMKHQKEMEEQRKPDYYKDVQKSKNVTGPPVYYPPGHEMFAKKEEGAWQAEGAMAKESGKYKYEAESKSKSKSSSGATIVPVCLPLCCGLPCTIL